MSFSFSAKLLRHLVSLAWKYILAGSMPTHYIFFFVHFNMLEIWLSTLEMEQSLLVPKLVSVYFSSIVLKHPFLFS